MTDDPDRRFHNGCDMRSVAGGGGMLLGWFPLWIASDGLRCRGSQSDFEGSGGAGFWPSLHAADGGAKNIEAIAGA